MTPSSISLLTVCGLEELAGHGSGAVTNVLSILDPERADPPEFAAFGPHRRTILRFHDIIEPVPGQVMPSGEHMDEILRFGRDLAESPDREGHLLVHCHVGISRSTAAMTTLIAQAAPDADEHAIFRRILEIRPIAWPNYVMIGLADERLGRGGRLKAAVPTVYAHQLTERPRLAEVMRGLGRGREVDLGLAQQARQAA